VHRAGIAREGGSQLGCLPREVAEVRPLVEIIVAVVGRAQATRGCGLSAHCASSVVGPLRQQCCLAVAGRRDNGDHSRCSDGVQPVDQRARATIPGRPAGRRSFDSNSAKLGVIGSDRRGRSRYARAWTLGRPLYGNKPSPDSAHASAWTEACSGS
jgi:hypothetical protein